LILSKIVGKIHEGPTSDFKTVLGFFWKLFRLVWQKQKERKKEKLNIARKLVGRVCQTNP
jgi:hypothetical protein